MEKEGIPPDPSTLEGIQALLDSLENKLGPDTRYDISEIEPGEDHSDDEFYRNPHDESETEIDNDREIY